MKRATDDVRVAACEGKRTFDTFKKAQAVACRNHRGEYARLPYHCPACHKYHVGTPKPKPARLRRAFFTLDDPQEA
jgi:hypothetical protein